MFLYQIFRGTQPLNMEVPLWMAATDIWRISLLDQKFLLVRGANIVRVLTMAN